MGYSKVWSKILVNRSNRPILDHNEYNVLICDNVGLYQGKSKILNHQNGRLYLTNQRLIYFDNVNVQNCICLKLNQVVSLELVERFLRSSPKVKLFLRLEAQSFSIIILNWACKICSFNNHIRSNFDIDEDEIPKCTSCGIKPSLNYIRQVLNETNKVDVMNDGHCPRCTFVNHPSIKYCEMCGTELIKDASNTEVTDLEIEGEETYTNNDPYVKISFRKGGERKFYQECGRIIDEIKWEILKNKGGVNQNGVKVKNEESRLKTSTGGIHALELIGEEQRKQNEAILTTSLDDIEQLMFKYQDLLKLSHSFNLSSPKHGETVIPQLNIKRNSSLYHQEISRHISEYSINYKLLKNSSMITLQDLFAEYNRFLVNSQGFGCELIDSFDFLKSVEMLDKLNLPIVTRKYKSGLSVVCPRDFRNIYSELILEYLNQEEYNFTYQKLRSELIEQNDELRDTYGKSVSEVSKHFNWSYNITIEEMDKCVESDQVVIDKDISGTFYYANKFNYTAEQWEESQETDIRQSIIEEQKQISLALRNEHELKYKDDLVRLDPDYSFGIETK